MRQRTVQQVSSTVSECQILQLTTFLMPNSHVTLKQLFIQGLRLLAFKVYNSQLSTR